jgi:hypothetical protein
MGHGGPRKGAGRPLGAAAQKTREIADRASQDGILPLEVMLSTMRELWAVGSAEAKQAACAVAKDAAPYMHPRLNSTDANVKGEFTGGFTWHPAQD